MITKNWDYIMIHHSLTKDQQVVDWKAIKKYHIEVRGWRNIGYHYGVEKVNGVYQVMLGRDLNIPGAHCKEENMNRRSVGVCVVGNYDKKKPPLALLKFLACAVVLPLMRQFRISVCNIVKHREYATYKSCPGAMFDVQLLRQICFERW